MAADRIDVDAGHSAVEGCRGGDRWTGTFRSRGVRVSVSAGDVDGMTDATGEFSLPLGEPSWLAADNTGCVHTSAPVSAR